MMSQVLHGEGLELAEVLKFSPHQVVEPGEAKAGTRRYTVRRNASASSKCEFHEAFFSQLLSFQYFERHEVGHQLSVFLENAENNLFHELLSESLDQETDPVFGRILIIEEPVLLLTNPDVFRFIDLVG
jgi:hypothetical protein